MTAAGEPAALLLGGDAMLGRLVNEVIAREGSHYPLAPLLPVTRAADAFFVNLECAVTPRPLVYSGPPKWFYFRADPPALDTLAQAGVRLVSLANNHALDADPEGLRDTLRLLDERGIAHVGAGENLAEASRPAVISVGGQRVGVLAYCDHQEDFAAAAGRPGIRYVDVRDPATGPQLAAEVSALAREVDHVVVAFHWQPNWVRHVPPPYRALASALVAAGARLIWGHSPHHFQGVEWLGTGAVIYSCGGLVDDYALEPSFRNDRQLLFCAELNNEGIAALRAYPIELQFARTRPARGQVREWTVARLAVMCAELGSRVEDRGDWLAIDRA